jgi:hypothetical protein
MYLFKLPKVSPTSEEAMHQNLSLFEHLPKSFNSYKDFEKSPESPLEMNLPRSSGSMANQS